MPLLDAIESDFFTQTWKRLMINLLQIQSGKYAAGQDVNMISKIPK